MIHLKDFNLVITGASSGIGRACALLAAELGARVALVSRSLEKLDRVRQMLPGTGHQTRSFDLLNDEGHEALIEEIVSKTGPVSGFIHSAGMELTLPFRSTRPEHFRQLFDLNAGAGFELARIIAKKKYICPEGASFVFISSIRGIRGKEANSAYCSSKGALIAGARAIALELAKKNIRVNSISPGLVKTPMVKEYLDGLNPGSLGDLEASYPLGLGNASDIASASCFLLSSASRWITGANLIVDGGFSCG